MYTRLDQLRGYTRERLSRVLLESGGTPQARSERESYTQLYTDDIVRYDAAEHGLCFGRLDMDDGETRRIGRIGIRDEDDFATPLLLDWRAPLARPFYLATALSPDGVARRLHLRTRNRRVTGLSDEHLSGAADAGRASADGGAARDATSAGVAGEEALLTALEQARTGRMSDIVETIQGQQDTIIRSGHRGVLVVQGGPGTGKTAVALHRAAFLLYTHRKQLARSGVLVIGPNPTFLDYIARVLPSLGETGVLLSTIGDLYPGVTAEGTDGRAAAAVKGSLDVIAILKKAVRDRQGVPDEPITVRFDGYSLRIDKKMCTRARGRARSSRRPHNLARPLFRSVVIDALADQLAETIGTSVVDGSNLLSAADLADIRHDLRQDQEVRAEIDALYPELTPQQVLSDLFASEDRLRSAAPGLDDDQVAALLRPAPAGFSDADAPLLDELAELLGVDDSAEQDRERSRWRRQIADAQGALDILTGSAPQDLEDELDPEILMAYDLIDADELARRHDTAESRTAAERAAEDRTWAFGHVIVDEAQELSPMAWRMLMRRSPNRWMTVVGDTAQTGAVDGASAWDDVLSPYVAQRWRLAELTVNYRTPGEIMAVAAPLLAAIDPAQTPPVSVRDSGHPPESVATESERIEESVAEVVAALPPVGTAAVLCTPELVDRLRHLGGDRVDVMPVADVKGLEFDSVIVVEPDAIIGGSERGLADLYVALTRATQRLSVVHSRVLPRELAGLRAVGGVPAAARPAADDIAAGAGAAAAEATAAEAAR
ncbi:HelD family protein [Tomitella fengzijianii]|uniref:AAA family ATPase n=1 Tax=Tomitella fengzijianii TaxID=2597660 RepID=A0A516X884_9ACTN|nr:AAA family ATPase [Tomitella fengzijianii]QDQ99279.1 AAA family ATPase [Tomitella fengzijianii]